MEKHRRDKMNAHINSLAQLVPTVANAPKKMDKTSILRLTAAYLRLHKCEWHTFLHLYIIYVTLQLILTQSRYVILPLSQDHYLLSSKLTFLPHVKYWTAWNNMIDSAKLYEMLIKHFRLINLKYFRPINLKYFRPINRVNMQCVSDVSETASVSVVTSWRNEWRRRALC